MTSRKNYCTLDRSREIRHQLSKLKTIHNESTRPCLTLKDPFDYHQCLPFSIFPSHGNKYDSHNRSYCYSKLHIYSIGMENQFIEAGLIFQKGRLRAQHIIP